MRNITSRLAGLAGSAILASAAVAADDTTALNARIGAADPALGEERSAECKLCHTVEKGGRTIAGPNLWGVVMRDKASLAGFRYTPVFKALEGKWTYEDLDKFLEDPMGYAPGTMMMFQGVKDADERAAVIAYLRLLADDPAPVED